MNKNVYDMHMTMGLVATTVLDNVFITCIPFIFMLACIINNISFSNSISINANSYLSEH